MSRYTGRPLQSRLVSKHLAAREAGRGANLRSKIDLHHGRGRKLRLWEATPSEEGRRLVEMVRSQTVALMQCRDGSLVLPLVHPHWKTGNRLFFRLLSQRSVVISRIPTGALSHGRLQTSRVKRLRTMRALRQRPWTVLRYAMPLSARLPLRHCPPSS